MQGVLELSHAVDFLNRRAQRLAARGDDDEGEETAAAKAADDSLRQVLMCIAARLEGAVEDVCVPPLVAQPTADLNVVRASNDAARSMWHALKVLANVCRWSELLAAPALQDLASLLLLDHVVPYLRTQLSSAAPAWKLIGVAVLRAATSLPLPWRTAQPDGGATWSTPLRNFIVNEVVGRFVGYAKSPIADRAAEVGSALVEALGLLQDIVEADKLKTALSQNS